MATVRTNPVVNGLSGMLGQSIVFKNYNGKTIATSKAKLPEKQSAQQKTNRSKFRDASQWAQNILLDPLQKEYYKKKAKKLKLPNAYTAAITDYMRSPKLITFNSYDNTVTCNVSKKDFALSKVDVVVHNQQGEEVRTIIPQGNEWFFKLAIAEMNSANYVKVTDSAGNETVILLIS